MRCLTSEVSVVFIKVLLMPRFGAKVFNNDDEEGIFSSTFTKLELSVVFIELSAEKHSFNGSSFSILIVI